VVIAKENINLQLAWHLSAQIRAAERQGYSWYVVVKDPLYRLVQKMVLLVFTVVVCLYLES
jgi:hypothetical protein